MKVTLNISDKEYNNIKQSYESLDHDELKAIEDGIQEVSVEGSVHLNFETMRIGLKSSLIPGISWRKTFMHLVHQVCHYNAYQKKILAERTDPRNQHEV